ncbi:MAG: hypothetical protein RLZZ618_3565 [Pseudomonadota bacterium]|jgi:hypothetical protein
MSSASEKYSNGDGMKFKGQQDKSFSTPWVLTILLLLVYF